MFKTRLGVGVLFLAGLFGLGLAVGLLAPRWLANASGPRTFSSAALLQQVKTVSELVTVQYVIEKVVITEDMKWVPGWGENRVLLVAHGVVKAGLDLSRLQPNDIQTAGKAVRIKLPPPQVTEAYLDEKQTRVVERTTGFLRSFDKDLEQIARQKALDEIRAAAQESGILKDAETRARTQVGNLCRQLGFERVDFVP